MTALTMQTVNHRADLAVQAYAADSAMEMTDVDWEQWLSLAPPIEELEAAIGSEDDYLAGVDASTHALSELDR